MTLLFNKISSKKIISLALAGVLTSSCIPMVAGGVATVGGAAIKEKGVGGAMSDTSISTRLKMDLYAKNREMHAAVGANVQHGEVLLTGAVADPQWVVDAEQIAWNTQGVTRVINNLSVSKGDGSVGVLATDSWATTQIKSALLFDGDIRSVNYSIKTVGGVVYIMGIAQNQAELDRVVNHCRTTKGVKKVKSFVKIKQNTTEP